MNNYDQVKIKNRTRKQYWKAIERQLTSFIPSIVQWSHLLAFISLGTYLNQNRIQESSYLQRMGIPHLFLATPHWTWNKNSKEGWPVLNCKELIMLCYLICDLVNFSYSVLQFSKLACRIIHYRELKTFPRSLLV